MLRYIKKKLKRVFVLYKHRNIKLVLNKHSDLDFNSRFGGANRIGEHSFFKGKMGYGSYIGSHSHLNAQIGKYCCIGSGVHTLSGKHPIANEFVSLHPAFYSVRKQEVETYVTKQLFNEDTYADEEGKVPVIIGNDVLLGYGATIMGGVKIGDGAVVAANATVVKDVEPYTIVGGLPAKLIKKRFTDDQITFLCNFRWWDRDIKWIKENANKFQDIEQFILEFEKEEK